MMLNDILGEISEQNQVMGSPTALQVQLSIQGADTKNTNKSAISIEISSFAGEKTQLSGSAMKNHN